MLSVLAVGEPAVHFPKELLCFVSLRFSVYFNNENMQT